MNQFQTVLDALDNGLPEARKEAIAIVKQMMHSEPVAWMRKDDDMITASEKRPDYAYTQYYDKPLFTAPQAVQAWLPISSAPKDGTMFDGWNGERVVDVTWEHPSYSPTGHHAWCVSGYTNGHDWAYDEVKGLTHWLLIPSSPKGAV
jgi:hypothetical protein